MSQTFLTDADKTKMVAENEHETLELRPGRPIQLEKIKQFIQ